MRKFDRWKNKCQKIAPYPGERKINVVNLGGGLYIKKGAPGFIVKRPKIPPGEERTTEYSFCG